MLDTIANVLGILTAAIMATGYVLRHRAKLASWYSVVRKLDDWYYEVYCFVFRPGRKGRNATASITVEVVGVVKTRHDPYSGERFAIRSNDVHAPPMLDADEQRQLIFRLPPE